MAAVVIKPYMIKVYAILVKGGSRTIDQIPQEYIEAVVKELEESI